MDGPSIRIVRRLAESQLRSYAPRIDVALQRVYRDVRPLTIFGHFDPRTTVDELPAITLEQTSVAGDWLGMPNIARAAYSVGVWGIVHHEDPATADDLIAELAAEVANCLNAHHEARRLDPATDLFYAYHSDTMPVPSVQFGSARFGTVVVRAFVAQLRAHVLVSTPDRSGVDPTNLRTPTQPPITEY